MTTTKQRRLGIAGLALSFALAMSGCAGFGNLGNEPGVTTVTLASVNNPQMQDMAQLLPEFNKAHPDIKINMIFMEENDLRNAITKDVATKGGQYDIMTVGAYEVPIWGAEPLAGRSHRPRRPGPDLRRRRLLQAGPRRRLLDDRLYAVPFYGESSFLMYRKDLFEQAGHRRCRSADLGPDRRVRRQAEGPGSDRAGICLRGKPGWGELFAPLTTVVNTFGGQWYDMDWQAQVTSPAYKEAVKFYIDTLAESGQADPVSFGFTECLNLFCTGPGGDVVRRHVGRGLGGGSKQLQGRRQGRLRPGPGQADRELGLAVVVEPRHQRRVRQQGPGLGVREVGHLQGVREAGRLASSAGRGPHREPGSRPT